MAESKKVQAQSFQVFSDGTLQYRHTTVYMEYCQPQKLTKLQCSGFLLGFHDIGMTDWVPIWLISASRSTAWPKTFTLKHMLGLSVMVSSHLRLLCVAGSTLRSSMGSFLNKDHPIRYVINYIPEAECKGQTFLWTRPNSILYSGLASLFTVPSSSTSAVLILANTLK